MVAVLRNSLGDESSALKEFIALRYFVGFWVNSPDQAESDARFSRGRVAEAVGLIDAAIYELSLVSGATAVEGGSYDASLWDHVKHSVSEERWEQVASAAVIYVEDRVRRWSGTPTDKQGRNLVGHALFVTAFATGGPLALGNQANETDGWRNLATGLVSALGNVDRHNIQERPDAKQYPLGVLGLASLRLTQVHYQHSASTVKLGNCRPLSHYDAAVAD
ncbi:TIGR02391 family protein [Amycolatopsis panacis]|uniref:TIGR02391 family protein n=1 Tax=Amycolatopsis panacis TaxID=2340917 RepID=UPI001314BD12|nr:TIGR02391 family protein [Amycolatopsis panacis]